jgi:Lon protease-like protein
MRGRSLRFPARIRGEGCLSTLLPLFPLDLVLFPGTLLPLHIFEPRYREMISECVQAKTQFGVVRVKEDGFFEVGCSAEVLQVSKTYDDGRMDILTAGRERFEIVRVSRERAFLEGEVLYLQDELNLSGPAERQHAIRLHEEMLTLAGSKADDAPDLAEDNLAYRLAGALPLDLDFKQTLLEMNSEAERVHAITSVFEAILPAMRRTLYVRQKAGGNGHAG